MVQTKKTNPMAFGDILAGLDGDAERASPARPSANHASASSAGIDVSWIKSAQARARAAQMAHQSSAPAGAEKGAPEKTPDAANRPRWTLGGLSWGWRGTNGADASPYAQDSGFDEGVRPTGPASDPAAKGEHAEGAATVETATVTNPVHALRRLIGQIPWGRWRAERDFAAAVEAAAETPAGPSPQPPTAPKSEDDAIAEELGLRPDLAIGDLRRIRRDFAKKNHPDRFEPALRIGAARRMTIANMLIDERMKQRRLPR